MPLWTRCWNGRSDPETADPINIFLFNLTRLFPVGVLMALMESSQKLKLGDRAPEFNLMGVDGKYHKLDDYSQARAILIVFMCNHCPYVLAKMPALLELHRVYGPKSVAVIGINSNNNLDYPDDSFEKMQEFVKEQGMRFTYLFDESQSVARSYGAVCTPDPFLFDGSGQLVYHGRIDDAMTPEAQPTKHELADAMDALLEGRLPRSTFLPSRGCSIKWQGEKKA